MVAEGIAKRNLMQAAAKEKSMVEKNEMPSYINDAEFENGQGIEKFIGATDAYGCLQFVIRWKSARGIRFGVIDASRVNKKYPKEVIAFYEKHLVLYYIK